MKEIPFFTSVRVEDVNFLGVCAAAAGRRRLINNLSHFVHVAYKGHLISSSRLDHS